MITLNLKEIFESRDNFSKSYILKPSDIKLPSELGEIKEETFVNVNIRKVKGGYAIDLEIESGIYLECSRCLEVYRKEVEQSSARKLENPSHEREIFLSEKDLNVSFMEEPDILNLTELVREELILSVPMKPLCSPTCSGINPGVVEDYKQSPADPRFAILKSLFAEKEVSE